MFVGRDRAVSRRLYHFRGRERPGEALKDLNRYLSYEPDDMEAAEKKMFALLNAGGNDEAAAYGDELVKDYPDEYEAYLL